MSVSGRLTCQVELSWCRNLETRHQVGLFLRFHCSAAHAYKHTQSLVAAGSVSHSYMRAKKMDHTAPIADTSSIIRT